MCGIVAAVANRNVVPILIEGLKRLEYLRNWSLLLDLQIVLKTALVVLKRSNAY